MTVCPEDLVDFTTGSDIITCGTIADSRAASLSTGSVAVKTSPPADDVTIVVMPEAGEQSFTNARCPPESASVATAATLSDIDVRLEALNQ
jgi:hypothetical protein